MILFQAYTVAASHLALSVNTEHPLNPPPSGYVLLFLILLQHLEIQTRDHLF
jgi:hypothetical protein